jgi:hypothetical protein
MREILHEVATQSRENDEDFLKKLQSKRNIRHQSRLQEELPFLLLLPDRKWNTPERVMVSVNPARLRRPIGQECLI